MNLALSIVIVIMLFVVLFNPQKWLRDHSKVKEGRPAWWALLLFFFISVYGGFIQAMDVFCWQRWCSASIIAWCMPTPSS